MTNIDFSTLLNSPAKAADPHPRGHGVSVVSLNFNNGRLSMSSAITRQLNNDYFRVFDTTPQGGSWFGFRASGKSDPEATRISNTSGHKTKNETGNLQFQMNRVDGFPERIMNRWGFKKNMVYHIPATVEKVNGHNVVAFDLNEADSGIPSRSRKVKNND